MATIKMQPVQAWNIATIGYDSSSNTLAVEFENETYHYEGVDRDMFRRFEASDSPEQFFELFIRRQFTGVKQPQVQP